MRAKSRQIVVSLLLKAGIIACVCHQVILAQTDGGKTRDTDQSAFVAQDCMRSHDVGNFLVGISNFGRIGTGMKPFTDCYTGFAVPRAEFPRGSNTTYLYTGGLWVGAVVGKDTLVSCGADFDKTDLEMHSDQPFIYRSTMNPYSPLSWGAVSEQDYEAVYTDTFTRDIAYPSFDRLAQRPHVPLNIEITQRSYAWSYQYTEDFILIDFEIRNIGDELLKDTYVGIYIDPDAHVAGSHLILPPPDPGRKGITDGRDDLVGFMFDYPAQYGDCTFPDTLLMTWAIDNDGDVDGNGDFVVPGTTGIRFLGELSDIEHTSFNWWVWNYNSRLDYGPQKRDNGRILGHGRGTPFGDVSKYYLLSNDEIDFDQAYTYYINFYDPALTGWIPVGNSSEAYSLTTGGDVQYLLSVGPFDLFPGDIISVPVAFVGGENVHTNPFNFQQHMVGAYWPWYFWRELDFADLALNANTAERIYDNPGIDTDGDGYFGEFHLCTLDSEFVGNQWVATATDTVFHTGDGVPDWTGSAPPPSPEIFVEPAVNGLRIRFNGFRSETTKDLFSGKIDFEGYRVYYGRDDRPGSYTLVTSYDLPNYDKYTFNPFASPVPRFEVQENPYTLEELRCSYGSGFDPCNDSTFDLLAYSVGKPYIHPLFPDSVFYFSIHDYNRSELGVQTSIRKLYPEAPPPDMSMPVPEDQLTEDERLKYYEYEVFIEGLLPSLPYYVSVTAFDYGSPGSGLAPLESAKNLNAVAEYPAGSEDELTGANQQVYIYPNPYRVDDAYREMGFEGIGQSQMPNDRVRQITFANLPPKCTIRINSLDGDLVREIIHDFEHGDPRSGHDTWNLITRNLQIVVSGLYYWSVEDDRGQVQIGKLVILF